MGSIQSVCPCFVEEDEAMIQLSHKVPAISLDFFSDSLHASSSSSSTSTIVSGFGIAYSLTEIDQDSAVWEVRVEEAGPFACGVLSKKFARNVKEGMRLEEENLRMHTRGIDSSAIQSLSLQRGDVLAVFFTLEGGPILRFKLNGEPLDLSAVNTAFSSKVSTNSLPPGGVYPYVFLPRGSTASVRVIFEDNEMEVLESGSLAYVTFSEQDFIHFQPLIGATSLI